MIAPIPNEVLDLNTLLIIREGVAKQKRLITGSFGKRRSLFGGTDYCAVGCVVKDYGDDFEAFSRFYVAKDVEPITIAKIIKCNDDIEGVTPEKRRDIMLDWLDRAIAYAENVKREIEQIASSAGASRYTELDKRDEEYAKTGEPVAA